MFNKKRPEVCTTSGLFKDAFNDLECWNYRLPEERVEQCNAHHDDEEQDGRQKYDQVKLVVVV